MSVNSYLENLASNLVVNSSEKDSIRKSIDTIKTRLNSYFDGKLEECLLFGSYTRGTILPRKADEESDIDLMVVFDNGSGYKPQTYLNKLKAFAEYHYTYSIVHQDRPSVVLELQHIKFDLVPAYRGWSSYYIPRDASNWQTTDPKSFDSKLTEVNVNNRSKVKPVIRLVKHWNIQKNRRDLASFELEKKIVDSLGYSYLTCTSYTDYLDDAFESIQYITEGSRVSVARSKIKEALKLEREGYPFSALGKIKEVFPEL